MASKMYVKAIRLAQDTASTKVVYEKEGNLYVRTGKDGFTKGEPLGMSLQYLLSTWGFRKVDSAPYFYDGSEMMQNINKFQLTNDGQVKYYS